MRNIYVFALNINEVCDNDINLLHKKHQERIKNINMQQAYNRKQNTESLLTTMFILDSLNKEKQPINKSHFSEREMDYYGLDDFEKDLVRKGEYAPWDFEHEDTVEGDYYHYD